MKYNQYSIETIKKLVKTGREMAKKYNTYDDALNAELFNYGFLEWEFISIGFNLPGYNIPEPETFYRIGEPKIDTYGGRYSNSYNYADDHPENGVSIITTAWLHSLKSIFFGADDDGISRRGVYKITGIRLPFVGGDDEPLICPLDWAEKTRIKTRNGLEKAVKKIGM